MKGRWSNKNEFMLFVFASLCSLKKNDPLKNEVKYRMYNITAAYKNSHFFMPNDIPQVLIPGAYLVRGSILPQHGSLF